MSLAAPTRNGTDRIAALTFKIQSTMWSGLPQDDAERLQFLFEEDIEWSVGVTDSDDVPFRPDARPVGKSGRDPVSDVYYAVEYRDASGSDTPFGDLSVSQLVVTLVEPDYLRVRGCTGVKAGGDLYLLKRREPAVQMPGGPAVFTLRFEAVRETAR